MSAVADILAQVNRLSPAERATLRSEWPKVVGRPVVKTPNICFGRARVDGTRIPVWTVERWRRDGLTDAEILDNLPSLSPADLESVAIYAAANRAEVDADIAYQDEELPLDEFEQIAPDTWVHPKRTPGT